MRRHNNKLGVVWLLCMLGGCARGVVPVIDLNQADYGVAANKSKAAVHTVARGDSLYSIAWQYGVSYRQLAATNGINAPYTIYPGQKLNLRTRARGHSKSAVAVPNHSALSGTWHWPTQGAVIARQSGFGRKKGIDISGKPGQPVFPAKEGKVVYSGNGIRGYGNLLIVKHDEEYLSAYAYNKRLLVAEGEHVKVGQKIAEIGTSGAAREAKLHFEIRRAGKAVDPLSLLPKRQNNVKI